MPTFKQGDVIRIPFPYNAKDTRQRRPALVVSVGETGDNRHLLWVVMITSADNRPWTRDVAIPDYEAAGLPAPSVIRPGKIATIETTYTEQIGKVSPTIRDAVLRHIRAVVDGAGDY